MIPKFRSVVGYLTTLYIAVLGENEKGEKRKEQREVKNERREK
jgi:hypothetical protein